MKDDIINELPEKGVDQIFSFINILKISSDVSEFREWLKEYHKIEDDSRIFEGYKFFLNSCVRGIIGSIIYDGSLDLEEDFTFFRARFDGVDIDDIPNTCEKTIFIKNIWNSSKKIRKSKDWSEITHSIEDVGELIQLFDAIYVRNVFSTKKLSKESASKISTIFNTHIFLNDIQHGIPHVYLLAPILKLSTSEKYLEDAYMGYAYALQHLWFVLLGKETFERCSLKNLHNAYEVHSKYAEEQIESKAGIPLSEEEMKEKYMKEKKEKINLEELVDIGGGVCAIVEELSDEDIKKLNKDRERLRKLKNWFALDGFFGKIQEEIIEPIEEELKIKNLVIDPLLVIEDIFDKDSFTIFLTTDEIKDPLYLEAKDEKLMKKKLNYLFLWYDVNVLDTQKSTIFNGVPAFTSTLIGNVELSRIFRSGEKVLVLRFKHPVKGVQGYDYSYGILIQAFGSTGLTDHSGWLIFFDCATDYSGFGGTLHDDAEIFIEKFLKEGKIEVGEDIVDREIFKEYLAEKSTSSVFDEIKCKTPFGVYAELSISEIQRKTEDFAGNAKGKFFEYLFYNWLTEEEYNQYIKVKCDYYLNKEQIDVFAETEDEVHIFECKVNLHSGEMDEIIQQLGRKVKDTNRQFSTKKIVPYLVVFSQIQNIHKEKFESVGIRVIEYFEKEIEDWKKFQKNKDSKYAIFRILRSKYPFELKT